MNTINIWHVLRDCTKSLLDLISKRHSLKNHLLSHWSNLHPIIWTLRLRLWAI